MADSYSKTWGAPSAPPSPIDEAPAMQLLLVKDGKDLNDWVWVWSEEEEVRKRAEGYAIFGETVWPQAEEMAVEELHVPPVISDEMKESAKEFRPRGRPRKAAP